MNCPETVTVNIEPVNWLKEKYPELCIKAGLCERIGGRLYTKTFIGNPPAAQRQWVGLDVVDFNDFNPHFKPEEAAKWAENKLKEKNHGN